MLTAEQNQRLTQVDPGTEMGELLRRYWYPVATNHEIHHEPVKAVRLLGENFTLFRDRSGRLGLIGQRCPHRNVNLKLGIPENEGLRCPYHGWMFDVNGQCLEMPAESAKSTFANRVSIESHSVEEMGGLIWAYIGPRPAPLLPRWALFVRETSVRQIGTTMLNCNWLQCQENSVDQVHAEYVHGHLGLYSMSQRGIDDPMMETRFKAMKRHHEQIGFDTFEYGIIKRRIREGDEENPETWRVGHPLVFPNVVLIGRPALQEFQIRVPVDETHTWHLVYECYTPGEGVDVPLQDPVPSFEVPVEHLPVHVIGQDMIAWEEQGAVTDRTNEKLTESDRGLILYRKMLDEQARIVAEGGDPICTFRDPEKNQSIELPMEEFAITRYTPNDVYYNNSGHFSTAWREIDELVQQGADRARERGEQLGPPGFFDLPK